MMAFRDEPSDSEALARFYEAHREELFKYASSILRDREQAADAVQEAFVGLMRSYDHVRSFSEEKLLGYSLTVVRNQCFRVSKASRSAAPYDPQDELGPQEAEAEGPDLFAQALDRIVLQNAVQKLQPNYSSALSLRYYYDFDDEAIAAVLHTRSENVRTILTRARRQLKKLCIEEVKARA